MTLAPLSDCALVLTLGDELDDATLARVHAVADALQAAAIPGVTDVVPAFATVTVYYDIGRTGPYTAFEAHVTQVAGNRDTAARLPPPARVEIPVCYGGEFGPDLEHVAAHTGLALDALIEQHSGAEYRVHAIGFVPGFAYLGGLPEKLRTPRRATPRPAVPAGSVGIGGALTGVYPAVTPGGWNLIGRTPVALFDVNRPVPGLLHAGDHVRFRAITPEEFAAWK